MNRRCRLAACALACLVAGVARYALAQAMIQLDPFVQATRGDAGCPVQGPPLLAQQQAQAEAHVRVERGLRCAMEGTCEPGGAYRRDAEINEQVRASIAGDRRFADTSVWITTSRKWVTLQGCVRRNSQRRALVALVARSPHVERVFDELKAGTRHNTR